ncbi:MAG: hypothetical protein EBR30_29520, partial [Cytophagia bacterium]|nr:hypothetical protein [Cytophagia bacterium]
MDMFGVERALEEIDTTLHKIFALLEQQAPGESQRERIALQFCVHTERTPAEALRAADLFLQECDRQRVRQAE